MAREAGIHVEGLRETLRSFETLGADVNDLKDVMARIATEATDVMRPFIPSASGSLRGSARPNRAKNNAQVIVGRARIRYAAPINYGWGDKANTYRDGKRSGERGAAMKGAKAGANFVAKTDAVMDTRALEILEDGLNQLITRQGLSS